MPITSLLELMKMPILSWENVTLVKMRNHFGKAGFSKEQREFASNYTDNPFQELQKSTEDLQCCDSDMALEEIMAEDIAPTQLIMK